jgi:O-antigen/teichoic acid export membrane protein
LIVVAFQTVILLAWMLRMVPMSFSGPMLWKMLAFGFPLMFSNVAVFALNCSDRFFLQHLRSLELVGIYAVGYKFGFMLNYLLVQPFYVMWQARMYIIHKQPQHPTVFDRIFVLYSLLLIYAGLALAMLSPELVHLMVGRQFAASQNVIPVVALAYVFYGIGFYAQTGMFLRDKTGLIGMIGAASAVLNLALNYFLIRQFGMMGAAWATLFSFAAAAISSYVVSQRVYPLALAVGRVMGMLTLAIGVYLVSRVMDGLPLGLALLLKIILLVTYAGLLWRSRSLSAADMEVLASAKHWAVGRFVEFRRRRFAGAA